MSSSLPAGTRSLLLRAVAVVVTCRVCLWLLPSRVVLRYLSRRLERPLRPAGELDLHRVAWAVRAVSRRVPKATCLTQAIAGQLLLARYGHRSELRIGVGRDARGGFIAHAWVETDQGVVIGNDGLHRYARLPDLHGVLG